MHSLVAATSDTVRVWDLEVSSARPPVSSTYQRARRTSLKTAGIGDSGAEAEVSLAYMSASYSADGAERGVEDITAVSWACGGTTFTVGGKGSIIRQYSRTGEHLQDLTPTRRADQLGVANIAAMQHYGANSEALFVANNTSRQVRRWDFVRRDYTAVCQTHENDISCMAVCTKKRLVVSATVQGGEIAVFNLLHNTRTDLRSATHKALTCIDISSGLRSQIAVGSEDGLVQLFDTSRSGLAPLKAFSHVHAAPVRGVAFHPTSSSGIVSVGLDGRIAITDVNAYTSDKSSAGISAEAPLSCLATTQDSYAIGVGTIDGGVLVYDVRRMAAPLWRSSIGTRRAVASMSLTRRADASGDTDLQPLRRAASTSSNGRGTRGTTATADEKSVPAPSSLAERPRARGSIVAGGPSYREARPGTAVSSVAATKGDASFRPPRHPSISRFRSAVSEHRASTAISSGAPKPSATSARPMVDYAGLRSPRAAKSGLSSEAVTSDEDTDHMGILAKDRSYMELLSPTMPDRTSSQVSEDKPELRRSDILSFLSRARTSVVPESQATASSRTLSDVNVDMASSNTRLQRSATDEVGSNGLSVAENDGVSPISQPHWPARSRPGARTHDAGDSIMELFTPERNKPAQLPTAAPNRSAGGEQPSSLAHTLVAQLLERHGNKAAVSAGNLAPGAGTASFVAPKSLPRHCESIVSNQRPESPESAGVHKPPPTAPLGAREDRGFSASSLPAPLASSSRAHDGDMKPPTLPDCLPPAPKRVCLADQQLQPPVPEPSAAALGGLGAIGSSVLHNLLADALAPLREQIRGEIRNLHVDMIRQGFVYQEQVRALRQECSEARELRQELELLRRENEQLRRHVPFFSLPTESALPESQGATRP